MTGAEGVGLKAEEKVYPSPLALHEDVIGSPTLLMETLRCFHSALGTRFMIPVIGGKTLDLHLLYAEVTKRGGFEKVVREKKWKEVIAAFKFPPTTTSASFVLRKYYISLLHHYEQVYYFRLQGRLVSPAVTSPLKSPPCEPAMPCRAESELETMKQKQHQLQLQIIKRSAGLVREEELRNVPVMGVIDGKFENGYFVTVTLGSDICHGVLFHVPVTSPPDAASSPWAILNNAIVPFDDNGLQRRRKRRRIRDPGHPKPNRSAYNFFFAEKHSELKVLYPQREREYSKMIGESWNKLTQEERMIYQDYGLKDKERYKREMQEYKERMKLVQPQGVA